MNTRSKLGALAIAVAAAAAPVAVSPVATADPSPTDCNVPACTPGIAPGVVLGAPCDNTTYYVFGVTSWGRLVFCGSPRRYAPRWFRAVEMHGIKYENSNCSGYDGEFAQAPDGLFLTCVPANDDALWLRGDA